MAKIEIASKPVKPRTSEDAHQHLYILLTNDNGDEIAYRGGPEGGDGVLDWMFDDLKVTKLPYDSKHPDYIKKDVTHTRKTLWQGTDAAMQPFIDKMDSKMDWINKQNFDYKLPTLGHKQNSNTVANVLIKSSGLDRELPLKSDGSEVSAPSWKSELRDTSFDRQLKATQSFAKETGEQITTFAKEVGSKISETFAGSTADNANLGKGASG